MTEWVMLKKIVNYWDLELHSSLSELFEKRFSETIVFDCIEFQQKTFFQEKLSSQKISNFFSLDFL